MTTTTKRRTRVKRNPGIYLSVVWAFVNQVVVMENLSGTEAMSRSKSLVEGYFGRVLGILLLLGLLVNGMVIAVQIALPLGLPFVEPIPGQIGAVLSPIVLPYFADPAIPLCIAGGLYLLGALCWLGIDPTRPIPIHDPVITVSGTVVSGDAF